MRHPTNPNKLYERLPFVWCRETDIWSFFTGVWANTRSFAKFYDLFAALPIPFTSTEERVFSLRTPLWWFCLEISRRAKTLCELRWDPKNVSKNDTKE